MARGLLDTSVFIAIEGGRKINYSALPDEGAICPVTAAELKVGVLQAGDIQTASERLDTYLKSREIELLVIDEQVADRWSLLRSWCSGSNHKIGVNDLWIAATAMAYGIPVYTQDDDFDPLTDVDGFTVIKV